MKRLAGSRLLIAALSLIVLAVLVGLGTWQLERLEWKRALIAAASERPGSAAVPPPGPDTWSNFPIDDWNYQRVRLTGQFGEGEAHAWTVLGSPKGGSYRGDGYFVVAPFITEDGWTVLVNRGFIPETRKDGGTRPAEVRPNQPVSVEGIIRRDDPPSMFTPEPSPITNTWFTRDITTMGDFLKVSPNALAPYTVDLVAEETPPSGLPQAGESQITFTNNHVQYAVTWYGLAAAFLGVLIVAAFRSRQSARS
ncbi:MAG: SURF1 family protein [Pseudomonadota bacterium]